MDAVKCSDRVCFFVFDRFIQQKLGGPSASEYENLQAEMSDLQIKYNQLLAAHEEICKEVLFRIL